MVFVRVAPELHLIYDIESGVIAEERDDVVEYSLSDVSLQIEELDKIVTDMMNQLSPNSELLSSFPGRKNAAYKASLITNAFFGAVIGLILSFLLLIIIEYGDIIKTLSGGP